MTIVQSAETIGGAVAEWQRRGANRGLRWPFWLCVAWLAGLASAAAAAGALPLSDPLATDIVNQLMPPNTNFWLGTDQLGGPARARYLRRARIFDSCLRRDIHRRGIRDTTALPAGYFRGRIETVLMGAADIGLAFPSIVLILLVAAYAGAGVINLILVLGILGIPISMRIARAVTLTFAQREFVVAARALGASHLRIIGRQVSCCRM